MRWCRVVGRGVEGETDEAFAVAAIDFDFADVEERGEAAWQSRISTGPAISACETAAIRYGRSS
jgi:hypothetical protein